MKVTKRAPTEEKYSRKKFIVINISGLVNNSGRDFDSHLVFIFRGEKLGLTSQNVGLPASDVPL